MRKPSYATLNVQAATLQHELWLTQIALQCQAVENPEAVVKVKEDNGDGRYRYALYRRQSAHSGVLIITFTQKGQSPSTTAHYFEEYRALASLQTFEKIACERLRAFQVRSAHVA